MAGRVLPLIRRELSRRVCPRTYQRFYAKGAPVKQEGTAPQMALPEQAFNQELSGRSSFPRTSRPLEERASLTPFQHIQRERAMKEWAMSKHQILLCI